MNFKMFSVSLQNVQLVLSCNPILHRQLLVDIRLCKDLKWNSIKLMLLVQRLAKQ